MKSIIGAAGEERNSVRPRRMLYLAEANEERYFAEAGIKRYVADRVKSDTPLIG